MLIPTGSGWPAGVDRKDPHAAHIRLVEAWASGGPVTMRFDFGQGKIYEGDVVVICIGQDGRFDMRPIGKLRRIQLTRGTENEEEQ